MPFAAAPELGDAERFVVAARLHLGRRRCRSISTGTARTSRGTIGQLTNNGVGVAGMAFNVRIMPVKVIDEVWDFVFGSPNVGTDDMVARGIRYAADNGAKVINMSIGRTDGGPAPVVEDAIRYAVARGVFVAVAAGNTADTGNRPNRARAKSRRRIDGMVAVGAVGRTLERAYYSTTGSYVEIVRARRRSARAAADRRACCSRRSIWICSTPTRAAAVAVRPAARRFVRLLLLPGHVDGDAARRRASRRC